MKYAFVAAALVAAVGAQTLADIPSCALPCIDDAVGSTTSCDTTDLVCICKDSNFSAIQGAATSCVIDKCGADVALNKVLPATEALCSAQGGGSDTTSAAAETSSEAAATTSEAAATTTEAAATTTAAATPSTTATVAPTVVVPPSNNGTAPTTTAVVPPTGAAAAFGPIGGLAMLGFAALAL